MPHGLRNWPTPSPLLPNELIAIPPVVNFWTRQFPESTTKTFPAASTARSPYPLKKPRLVPSAPKPALCVPVVVSQTDTEYLIPELQTPKVRMFPELSASQG